MRGMPTFAGPMAAYDFGAETPSAFTLDHCWGLLGADHYEIECPLDGPDFAGEGMLWGGNLAMVAHLVGTPHFPRVDGGILFLEDIGEHPYRVERMLYQLHFAGVLARQRAVLLGTFNGYELAANDNGYDAAAMVAHVRARFGPARVHGLPFGHMPEKLTLPVGGRCALAVRDGRARSRPQRLRSRRSTRFRAPARARSAWSLFAAPLARRIERALDEARRAVAADRRRTVEQRVP